MLLNTNLFSFSDSFPTSPLSCNNSQWMVWDLLKNCVGNKFMFWLLWLSTQLEHGNVNCQTVLARWVWHSLHLASWILLTLWVSIVCSSQVTDHTFVWINFACWLGANCLMDSLGLCWNTSSICRCFCCKHKRTLLVVLEICEMPGYPDILKTFG